MGLATIAAQVHRRHGPGMSLAFNPLQQRCLDSLGYILYALAGEEHDSVMSPAQFSNPATIATANLRDSKLLAAVLRVARMQACTSTDSQAWLSERGIDSIASLRGNPAAKRALWTTLRRERRTP